ncbi:MAG: hypothetical protein IJ030_05740 [Oscillospiraceae bacterium]|nr:hypothetical protein [Oscillospiraceae bacterium]
MLKLLIADPSEPFARSLGAELRGEFEIKICTDGVSTLEILQSFRPDALVLNVMLPRKDGLTILQESAYKPRIILGIMPRNFEYAYQRAIDLGVQYVLISPAVSVLRLRLMDMLKTASPNADPGEQAAIHLHILNFHTHLDGYRQLCVGIPIFAKNPGQLLSKELYPAIAAALGLTDPRTVEHSIRKSIADAWRRRDPAVWGKYFPPSRNPPTNKAFLSAIAELLVR